MSEPEIRLSIADVLQIDPSVLTDDTELESLPEFDSTARLVLMVCISDITGAPFELSDLERLKTYKDILDVISAVQQ